MSDIEGKYRDLSLRTVENLRSVASRPEVRSISHLSLPEIEAVTNLIGRVVPAGNVPGVVLSALARLSGRKIPAETVQRDIRLLFKGVEQTLDRSVYAAFFAGPAAVLWGYQNLLRLAGKSPESAFPDGTWQFYVEYALREDTARHANETHGFDSALKQHDLRLSAVDRMAAWVMAAIQTLWQYDDLLANEWRERVYTALLREVTREHPQAAHYVHLHRAWQKQIPYRRGPDAAGKTYPLYRRERFDSFLKDAIANLPADLRQGWEQLARAAAAQELPAYQRQLSMLAYLKPDVYCDARQPFLFEQAYVAVVYQGHYYLIPVCAANGVRPADAAVVRAQVAALVKNPDLSPSTGLMPLAQLRRAALADVRERFSAPLLRELGVLRLAPILINFDQRPRSLSLSEIRQAERGIGDHPLTILDTGETFVFDQSHIFFDGAWGAALAEIMTNEALSWGVYFQGVNAPPPVPQRPYCLGLHFTAEDSSKIESLPRLPAEAVAETEDVDIRAMMSLRRVFKQRSDLLELTINDLLVLYRAIHACSYAPDAALLAELNSLAAKEPSRAAAQAALEAIETIRAVNPAILIPVDASPRNPRERLYSMSFEVPLGELELLPLHQKAVASLNAYEFSRQNDEAFEEFDQIRRTYLATLAGFGEVLSRAKLIASQGESASVASIKMLAHLPAPLQKLLDRLPGRFDVLNDVIKGREVFSNVGAVAPSSTLTRFHSAKDDNEQKTLVWGAMTDAAGVMRISLRDFRPHVGMLEAIWRKDLAMRITADYLEGYALGLNQFIADLHRIAIARKK